MSWKLMNLATALKQSFHSNKKARHETFPLSLAISCRVVTKYPPLSCCVRNCILRQGPWVSSRVVVKPKKSCRTVELTWFLSDGKCCVIHSGCALQQMT